MRAGFFALLQALVHGLHFEGRRDVGGLEQRVEHVGDLGVLALIDQLLAAAAAEVSDEHVVRRALVAQVGVDKLLVFKLVGIGLLEPRDGLIQVMHQALGLRLRLRLLGLAVADQVQFGVALDLRLGNLWRVFAELAFRTLRRRQQRSEVDDGVGRGDVENFASLPNRVFNERSNVFRGQQHPSIVVLLTAWPRF